MKLRTLFCSLKFHYKRVKQYFSDLVAYNRNDFYINYSGFWNCSRVEFMGLNFVQPLSKVFDKNVSVSVYKPYIKYYSVFTEELLKNDCKNYYKKIFFTGEDVHVRYPKFNSYCLDVVDLALGFDYEDEIKNEKYLRYPLWMCYYFTFTLDKDEIKKQIDWFNSKKNGMGRYCALVASHDDMGIRTKMYEFIQKSGINVKCGGKLLHNDDTLINDFNDNKIEYLSQFMFNLCPENVSVRGYTTEKIFQSFAAGCIPVYYGSNGIPEQGVINPDSYILYNGNNEQEVCEKMHQLMNDSDYLKSFLAKPRLLDSAVDYIYERNLLLKEKYEKILNF